MAEATVIASRDHRAGELETTLEFLKGMRSQLRTLRLVRVWRDRLQIIDINGDAFEVGGLGYRNSDIVHVLDTVNANFKRETIHADASAEYKEFKAGRRYAWAADRVM